MGYHRVEPMKELENIASKMRKFIDEFPDSFSFEVGGAFNPRVDVIHNDATVTILVELPGVAKEDIRLVFEENSLILKGEKKKPSVSDKDMVARVERNYGTFNRSIFLPADVVPSSVDAKLDAGVLTVTMQKVKTPQQEHVHIEIK